MKNFFFLYAMSSLSPVAFENNDEEGTLSKGLVFFKNWRIFSLSVLLKKKTWKLHESSMLEAGFNFGHYNSVALHLLQEFSRAKSVPGLPVLKDHCLWVHSLVYTAILDLLTIHPWGLTIRIDFIQESSVRH